jgi:hypothetical protein
MWLRLRRVISFAIKLALAALKVDDQTPKLPCLFGVLNRKTLAECVSEYLERNPIHARET